MPALRNVLHERFANAIAAGINAKSAYVEIGYSPNGAAQAASRLAMSRKVKARVEEICNLARRDKSTMEAFDKARVLNRLDTLGRAAEAARQFAAAIRCEELIGKEHGMFTDSSRVAFEWDGDLAKLPPEIRLKFMAQLEGMAFGSNQKAAAEARAQVEAELAAEEGGLVERPQ